MTRRIVPAQGLPVCFPGVPAAVVKGGLLFVSTVTGVDSRHGRPVSGALPEQARQAYGNLGAVLSAAGATPADVVKASEFVTSAENDQDIAGARRGFLGADFPIPTSVAMPQVAGAGNLLSVDAIGVVRDGSRRKVLRPAGGPSGDLLSPSGVTKGAFLFTCRATAARRDVGTDQVVCTGTLAQQMAQIYDNMELVLKAANASFDDIVMTTEFVTTTEGYRETSDVRRRLFKNGFPAATGVICGGLGQPNALIALEAVVVLDRDAARQIINPGWPHYERYTFCPGIRRGDYLFISGATATETDASGKVVVRGGVAVQAQLIYDRARAIVEAAGGAMKDIVHVTEYVTLLHAYDTVGAVRGQVFGDAGPVGTGHGPAVSTVVVKGLLRPDALIEIDAVAVLG